MYILCGSQRGGKSGGAGVKDMGRASALRQLSNNDRCVTLAPGTSADIDSGPFRSYDIPTVKRLEKRTDSETG